MLPGQFEGFEHIEGAGIDADDLLVLFHRKTANEVTDEVRDVFAALAERRQRDRKTFKRLEQIFAEFSFRDLLLQIAVGRRGPSGCRP